MPHDNTNRYKRKINLGSLGLLLNEGLFSWLHTIPITTYYITQVITNLFLIILELLLTCPPSCAVIMLLWWENGKK